MTVALWLSWDSRKLGLKTASFLGQPPTGLLWAQPLQFPPEHWLLQPRAVVSPEVGRTVAQCPAARRLWFSFAEPSPGSEATKSLCVCAERRGQPVHLLLWPSVYPGMDWGGPSKLVAVGPPGGSPGSLPYGRTDGCWILGSRGSAVLGLQACWYHVSAVAWGHFPLR